MFRTNFSNCPHFNSGAEANLRLNNLEVGYQAIIHELKDMRTNDNKFSDSLNKHMEDEEVHHENTIISMNKIAEAMQGITEEQKQYREERDVREASKARRQKLVYTVATSVITALSIAATFWLLNVLTNLEKVNKAIGVS